MARSKLAVWRTSVANWPNVRDALSSHRVASGGTQLRRDVSQELDDYFEIVIDSSHNRRNAYLFQTNPLGTQRDGLITDEQGLQNSSSDQGDGDPGWDGVWTSEAHITSEGWTATIQIPFSTLNFMQSHATCTIRTGRP